jgi:nucleotide-binding universal stress UspA family protein
LPGGAVRREQTFQKPDSKPFVKARGPRSDIIALCSLVTGLSPVHSNGGQGGRKVAAHGDESSLVLVVGFEGSDPARRALAAAGRILGGREGWIEIVYVDPAEAGDHDSPKPAADVTDSLGSAHVDLHYEVRSVLDVEKQPWRWRSTSGAVAEELTRAALAIADEGGPSRTVVIVVGSDHRLAFSVPVTLARQSSFPVIIVP